MLPILLVIILMLNFKLSVQDCPEEISKNGIKVTWPATPANTTVESQPVCYCNDDESISRTCNETTWSPPLNELEACLKTITYYEVDSCPPGFHKISNNSTKFCYKISEPSVWDYPCFNSGGASVITDLTTNEINSLLRSLASTNISRYFYLPAKRPKIFNPLLWYIPGPFWGTEVKVTNNELKLQSNILKNCLVLDVKERVLRTQTCNTNMYPSLCFYLNEQNYPAQCPNGYHAFRFISDDICFGIEKSDIDDGMSYNEFLKYKCNKPMGNPSQTNLASFAYTKLANLLELSEKKWCWFTPDPYTYNVTEYSNETEVLNNSSIEFAGAINNHGTLTMMNAQFNLTCMACEKEMIYKETDISLEYNTEEMKMFLTIYHPQGLWKYDNDDRGIRCFSNAKGFVVQVEIEEEPYIDIIRAITQSDEDKNIEKIVYVIDLIANRTAQYWCEAHTTNFSLLATNQIIVNPRGDKEHVFALVSKFRLENASYVYNLTYLSQMTDILSEVFSARKVLLMDVLEIRRDDMILLFHLHMATESYDDNFENIDLKKMFTDLKEKANIEIGKLNGSLVNVSSSIYCLPTTSQDIVTLNWELTQIGQVVAPTQFCLQSNGLPVKRQCLGSYLLGGFWGPIDGSCDQTYQPSNTTTFLYNFVREKDDTTNFLSDGLHFVLQDVDTIIPADIYYLAMSLDYVSHVVQENETALETSHLDQFSWAVGRLMLLDSDYLRLAQTLNSTNIILESITEIIQAFATKNRSDVELCNKTLNYQLSVNHKFVVQISYPYLNNISGIALIGNGRTHSFDTMTIRPLYMNSTYEELVSIKNLEIATWIPKNVLTTLKLINNSCLENRTTNLDDIHIIVHIFHNDAVFQELGKYDHTVDSRIVEVSIPGFETNLDNPVPIIFRNDKDESHSEKFCGYWDFKAKRGIIPGNWQKTGCFLIMSYNNLSMCECYHLTHFANLIRISHALDGRILEESHRNALNIITIIGAFLSLLGITGIWVTALTFTSWRRKPGTKVLLQLSTAIALPLFFIIYFNTDNGIFVEFEDKFKVDDSMRAVCIAVGASLHYSILAGFVWMLIIAVLQFIRYVRVLGVSRPARFMLKLSVIGWGVPVFPVSTLLIVDKENYIPPPENNMTGLCYPNGSGLIFSLVLPVCLILIVNIILFLLVIFSISRGPDGKMRATDLDLVKSQFRLSIFLFFLLGLTWIFGIFSFSSNLWWSYLFCLTSTPQGFVLFLYFVICDPETRNMWITLMKPQFRKYSSRDSISCSSTTSNL